MFLFFQAEDGIRDLVRSRGLGDVYKRQTSAGPARTIATAQKTTGNTSQAGGPEGSAAVK